MCFVMCFRKHGVVETLKVTHGVINVFRKNRMRRNYETQNQITQTSASSNIFFSEPEIRWKVFDTNIWLKKLFALVTSHIFTMSAINF